MKLPFTTEQFLEVFRHYNLAIFPLQIVFYLLSAVAIALATIKMVTSNKIINLILSFLWLWMGIVYHLVYFVKINKAAYLFGTMFVIQALLLFFYGVTSNKLSYSLRFNKTKLAGAVLIAFALIFYPLVSYFSGHVYPKSPTFGVPCPTTIFTFGMFLLAEKRIPILILTLPILWSVVGFFAAIKLGMYEDTGLLIAGLLTAATIFQQKNKVQPSTI